MLLHGVGNSARCQMSGAIRKHLAADDFGVSSAGLEPSPIDSTALAVLEAKGFETSECDPRACHGFTAADGSDCEAVWKISAFMVPSNRNSSLLTPDMSFFISHAFD